MCDPHTAEFAPYSGEITAEVRGDPQREGPRPVDFGRRRVDQLEAR
jgi:hypothetical protein